MGGMPKPAAPEAPMQYLLRTSIILRTRLFAFDLGVVPGAYRPAQEMGYILCVFLGKPGVSFHF